MTENNAARPMRDPINEAILLLTEEADSVSDCHTRTPGDWAGEPEAKAHYDHVRSVVDALSKLRAPVADELPRWKEISAKLYRNETLTPLEFFIYENEPAGGDGADAWRDQLASALASAPVAGETQERIEQMAVNRYRPVPDGKFSYKVVAGDGSRSLYTGTKDSCLRVAAKLTEAFLDGAFSAANAAPQASAEDVRNGTASKRYSAIDFDGWIAMHCDCDDLTAYERKLARDAWDAAMASHQGEPVDLPRIDADRLRAIAASGSQTAMSNALLNVARALKTQADKDGVQQRAGDAEEALTWYAEQVAGCRKLGPDGDAARNALDRDGGQRARAALSATQAAQSKVESRVGTNAGHGHVWARPDGLKVRCGGPGICIMCSKDHAHATQAGQGERR